MNNLSRSLFAFKIKRPSYPSWALEMRQPLSSQEGSPVEVFNSLYDMLGVEGLEALILESAQRPILELKQAILNGVAAWRHGPSPTTSPS